MTFVLKNVFCDSPPRVGYVGARSVVDCRCLHGFAARFSTVSNSIHIHEFVTLKMNNQVFENDGEFGPAPDADSSGLNASLAECVYLVDDDLEVLKLIGTMLRISGYEVKEYSAPSEFLDDSKQLPPGVVVTDQHMGLIEGTEVQRRLSDRPNHFKTILITGYSTTSLAVTAMKNGAVTVLDKPFECSDLLAAVKEAFRQLKHADSFDEVLPPVLPSGASYLDRLSVRERDVIELIYRGSTNKSTGIQLGISYKTVEKHRSSAMRKLEVASMASLVRLLDRDLGRQ